VIPIILRLKSTLSTLKNNLATANQCMETTLKDENALVIHILYLYGVMI